MSSWNLFPSALRQESLAWIELRSGVGNALARSTRRNGPRAVSVATTLPGSGTSLGARRRATVAYGRVFGRDQKEDLVRQVALLESFCAANGWAYEVIQDPGSGLNYRKKGLRTLIARIGSGEVGRLVITHKDRLLRFGSDLVFRLCEHFGTEVVIVNASEEASFENELVQDVPEIITVFSARLYGSHSHKNKTMVQALKAAAEEVAKA